MLFAFVATVLGGMGSLRGAVLGGYVFGAIFVALQAYLPLELRSYRDAFAFARRDRDAARPPAGPDRRPLRGDTGVMGALRVLRERSAGCAGRCRRCSCSSSSVAEIAWATGGPVTKGVVVVALINLILVVGLYVFVGNSGVFSFGSIGFAAIGAYTAGLLVIPTDQKAILQPDLPGFIAHTHLGSIGATLMGGLVAAVVAAVLRDPADAAERARRRARDLRDARDHSDGREQLDHGDQRSGGTIRASRHDRARTQRMIWALLAIVAGFVFQSTGLGLRLRGSREDDVAARSLGVGVHRERRVAWVVQAFIMGVGGGLYAQYLGSFNASFFYLGLTFTTLAMLVVGGMTSLSGAVIGSLTISFIAGVPAPCRAGRGHRRAPHSAPARPARGGARGHHARASDSAPARD